MDDHAAPPPSAGAAASPSAVRQLTGQTNIGAPAAAAAASSAKRAATADTASTKTRRAKKVRITAPSTAPGQSGSALVRFFYGDLKRHLLHFMTRPEVGRLGRTSKHLTPEAMKVDEWPLDMSRIQIAGFSRFRALLQKPQRRQVKHLEWYPSGASGPPREVYEPLNPNFTHLISLHLILMCHDRTQPIISYVRAWQHSLQHLVIDVHNSSCWTRILSLRLVHLRTLELNRDGHMWSFWGIHVSDATSVCDQLLDKKVNEDQLPKLEEIKLRWKSPGRNKQIPAQMRSYVLSIQQKFRTPARQAAGIHFRCFIECLEGYTLEEQAVWNAAEEDADPMEEQSAHE
jgi:hypothetical protein